MRIDDLNYCEMWLEMNHHTDSFRVALLTPIGVEFPTGYEEYPVQNFMDKVFHVSIWFETIHLAIDFLNSTAEFYRERSIRFLIFREIRPKQKRMAQGS